MLAALAVTAVFPLVTSVSRGGDPYLEVLPIGAMLGVYFGVQAYFLSRPVPVDRLPLTLAAVAALGWVAGLVLGAELFGGGIIVGGLVVTAFISNRAALRSRARSARAREAYAAATPVLSGDRRRPGTGQRSDR